MSKETPGRTAERLRRGGGLREHLGKRVKSGEHREGAEDASQHVFSVISFGFP